MRSCPECGEVTVFAHVCASAQRRYRKQQDAEAELQKLRGLLGEARSVMERCVLTQYMTVSDRKEFHSISVRIDEALKEKP
jgi:hypothetical protein